MADAPLDHPWLRRGQPPGGARRRRAQTPRRTSGRWSKPSPSCDAQAGPAADPRRRAGAGGLEALVAQKGLESRRPAAGLRRQPVPLHEARRGVRPVLPLGRAARRADRGAVLRCPDRRDRLPRRVARDPRRRAVRTRWSRWATRLAIAAALDSALSGALAPPPRESWRRFEMDTVIDRYPRSSWESRPVLRSPRRESCALRTRYSAFSGRDSVALIVRGSAPAELTGAGISAGRMSGGRRRRGPARTGCGRRSRGTPW